MEHQAESSAGRGRVAPDVDVVIVRLGRDSGLAHEGWLATFRGIADQLMQEN
jgi:hypothetical protein